MTTQIVIHILPQEIDWFEWQSKQLKIGSPYITTNVVIDATLNLNLVDWANSKIPKEYFIEKFLQIEKNFDWAETIFDVDDSMRCLGIDDKRRSSIRNYNPDNFIYLDCDMIFKPETLALLISAASSIDNEYYIISPQVTKLWDNSWDVLSNEFYKNEMYGFQEKIDPYSILLESYGDVILKPIDVFKFGGGWINMLSNKLLKMTDIPDSFGPYGIDDTYVMYCCQIMKSKSMNVKQYVLENVVVAENLKYRYQPYTNLLKLIDKKDEFRSNAESKFNEEIVNFIKKNK